MQDVEQGEPQSQVLFRVTFLQCITLARQTLHHKSATYQQRHHEAARLPDPPARGPAPGSARPPPGSLRRIRTGEPAATGVGRRGRDRPGGDERHAGRRRSGERNHPRRAPPEPPPGRRRGERDHAGSAAPVEPLPSRRPPAAAASGITPAGADPAGRPGAAGPGSTGAAWGAVWGVCAMPPTRTPAVATTRPAGGYPGPDGARGSPVMTCPNRLLTCCKGPGAAGSAGVIIGDGPDGVGNGSGAPSPASPR